MASKQPKWYRLLIPLGKYGVDFFTGKNGWGVQVLRRVKQTHGRYNKTETLNFWVPLGFGVYKGEFRLFLPIKGYDGRGER